MMIGYVKEIVRDLNCIYLQNILMNSFLIFLVIILTWVILVVSYKLPNESEPWWQYLQ